MKMRASLVLICFLLLFSSTLAQPYHDWTRTIGGNTEVYNEGGFQIFMDKTKHLYTHGFFAGAADFNPGPDSAIINSLSNEVLSYYIAKYDTLGNNIWAFPLDFLEDNFFVKTMKIAVSPNGNTYLLSYYDNPLADLDPGPEETYLNTNDHNLVMAKYDTDGNYLWSKGFDIGSGDFGDIELDKNENIIISGIFFNAVDFNPGPGETVLGDEGEFAFYVAKYDSAGNFLWAKSSQVKPFPGGTVTSMASESIAIDSSNNIFIGGIFNGILDIDPGVDSVLLEGPSTLHPFVIKLNPEGIFQWGFGVDGEGQCHLYNIAIDNEQNLILNGNFKELSDFDPSDSTYLLDGGVDNHLDLYIAKYTNDGAFIWAFSLPSESFNRAYTLATSVDGSIYITGQFQHIIDYDPGPEVNNIGSSDAADIVLAKYSSNGDYDWAFSMGGSPQGYFQERGRGIVVDSINTVYTTGWFFKTCDFDPGPCTFNKTANVIPTSSDAYISKYTSYCQVASQPSINAESNLACFGDSITIQVVNYDELYNANYWYLFEETCGGVLIDSSEFGNFVVHPNSTTTYFIAGSNCCNEQLICDSVVILVDTIMSDTLPTISICGGDSILIFGNYQSIAQSYSDTISAMDGCDSIFIVELVTENISSEIIQMGDTLIAVQGNVAYQWYDCDSNSPIDGATMQYFIPETSGNYALEVSLNGCQKISDCFSVNTTSFISPLKSTIKIYPNPAQSSLFIESNSNAFSTGDFQFYDTHKRLIFEGKWNSSKKEIDTSQLSPGIYFLFIQSQNKLHAFKICKI